MDWNISIIYMEALMKYTLLELLNSGILKNFRLLAGAQQLEKVYIDSISVQELPMDIFIHTGELVLTTALGCLDNEEKFLSLVKTVAGIKAAALIVTFEDPDYKVPPSVTDYASSAGLPMIEIPWDIRFSYIQTEVNLRIQEKRLASYHSIQTALFNLFFDSQPLDSALSSIYDTFHVPAALFDTGNEMISSFPENEFSALSKTEIEKALSVSEYEIPKFLNSDALDTGLLDIGLSACPDTWQTYNIYLNELSVGKFVFKAMPEAAIGENAEERTKLVTQYICFPLSLWFNRKKIEDMMSLQLRNDFIWNLANKNYTSFSDMVQQGTRLSFRLDLPYTCILIKLVPDDSSDIGPDYSHKTAFVVSETESLILKECQLLKLDVMPASRGLEFIIYAENPKHKPEHVIEKLLDSLELGLKSSFPGFISYFGISNISLLQTPFHTLYQNASLALGYCLNSAGKCRRFTYEDSIEMQVASILREYLNLSKIAENVIGRLRNYGSGSGIDLVKTLETYIQCNYNISMASKQLHIHRQSMLYRLEKIESVSEMSLKSHRDLFLLEIYLRMSASGLQYLN